MARPSCSAVLLLISFAFAACQGEPKKDGLPLSQLSRDSQDTAAIESGRGLLQRRRASILRNTLAKALVLHPQGLCLELGRIPCADIVHRVSLGGMDAYGSSQYLYARNISVTGPNSFDRLILSACVQRANLDIVNLNDAKIFKNLEITIDGRLKLTDKIDEAIDRLYQRVYLRESTEFERATLKQMYEEIYAAQSSGAARNWMVLSCYTVLSSVEGVFY